MTDPISRLRQIADASGDSLGLVTVEAGDLRALVAEHRCTGERHPDPIGTALIERARLEAKRESEVSRMRAQSKSLRQAGHEPPRDDLYMWSKPEQTNTWKLADALQSRIAEVGRLTEALDDCVASLAAIRATAGSEEWASSGDHFSTVCLESLKVARAALSLQRRV